MALFSETADVSVRPAVAADDAAITRVQVAAWRATHAQTLGDEVVDLLDVERMRASWHEAITRPPGRGFGVLVACDRAEVVGFAAVTPGQLLSLEVVPGHRRGGHGSRLLSAAVDRLRQDGADDVATWVLDGDDAREQFLSGAGLGPDGTQRTLAAGPREVVERRWSAAI
ncbi:GNAT family N-acetyltransferase [Cellulomonas sp. PhB143]|uniref:GNAT family N-acetyltransferase n=1 Tax=Cellulomonas sp. PhB143 TaxID=2485186 RepID=UPI000F4985C7|nr:GNAT family N-acetyltransferase [Cellulomonas sp. PhB143]ROS77156.1 acetyltransferase (GNAT) family protein [Cellulomonas sp. PhB143]